MVNTRNRPKGQETSASTTDHPRVITTDLPPRPQNILGGELEHVPRRNITPSEPIMEEVTPESRMMDRMIQAMNAAMAQQLKLLEDRDANNRRHEAVAKNIVVAGSGGTGPAIPSNQIPTSEARHTPKDCTFKAFLGCRPPEFKGSNDPVACMNWIREME
ncbi:hypothetical protein L6452_18800 [Arctium lappa]|uniref:Uncharacterized protein n=1 Tax=Arctium lappa TaxID=4217 RepID=A0ACB9C765_ARCLA|nr:hypothetical protein L6452_18800 [Arctium lappa]